MNSRGSVAVAVAVAVAVMCIWDGCCGGGSRRMRSIADGVGALIVKFVLVFSGGSKRSGSTVITIRREGGAQTVNQFAHETSRALGVAVDTFLALAHWEL